jgi:hypothetical protein
MAHEMASGPLLYTNEVVQGHSAAFSYVRIRSNPQQSPKNSVKPHCVRCTEGTLKIGVEVFYNSILNC